MSNKSKPEPVVKAGVGVIVCKGNKVLVGKRTGSHGAGRWAFPGGHVDPTDVSLKSCGEREVLEETGITCHVFKPDGYRDDLFTTFDILSEDKTKMYVTCYLIADYLIGGKLRDETTGTWGIIEPCEPDKCEGWFWVSLQDLANIVNGEKDESWIPVHQVIFYLSKLWNLK